MGRLDTNIAPTPDELNKFFENHINSNKFDPGEINLEDGWDLVNAYMYEHGMARAQLESYNYLVEKGIGIIIDSLPTIEGKCDYRHEVHSIKFSDGRLSHPHIVEQDTRKKIVVDEKSKSLKKDLSSVTFTNPKVSKDRKASYHSKIYVKCTWTITTRKPGEEEKVVTRVYPNMGFGYLPVMKNSSICPLSDMDEAGLYAIGEDPLDVGGYFDMNGGEKVLISQVRMIYNHVMVSQKSAVGGKTCYEAEIRSSREMCYKPASQFVLRYKVMSKGEGAANIRAVALPYMKQGQEIPVGIIFKALGITKDEDLCFMISHNLLDRRMLTLVRGSLREANKEVKTQEEALEYIGTRTTTTFDKQKDKDQEKAAKIKCARDLLTRDLFPHVGENFQAKAYYLGFMTNKLLSVVLGRIKEDDRDHYKNKRIITAGQLLGELFQQIATKSIKEFRSTLIKYLDEDRPLDIAGIIKEKAITQGIKYCISTGNWSANKIVGTKNGVSAVLVRISYLATLSHLNRVNTPAGKEGKLTKPRHLAGTQWGYTCGNETPESQSVGLVNNLALLCAVSLGDYSYPFMDVIRDSGIKWLLECSREEISKLTKVFVNGNWIGMIDTPNKLVQEMKELKVSLNINCETGVVYDILNNQVRINTDPGRTMRPLYVVRDNKLSITKDRIRRMKNNYRDGWFQIMLEGHVEYIDVDESEASLIAMFSKDLKSQTKKYTHCELHPGTILGVSAGTIPFANSNPGARNTFQW
jgi:DNA-directed RNA polymerase II subunit RPB2